MTETPSLLFYLLETVLVVEMNSRLATLRPKWQGKTQPHQQQQPRGRLRHGTRRRKRPARHAKFTFPIGQVADIGVALPREEVKTVDIAIVVKIASEQRADSQSLPCDGIILIATDVIILLHYPKLEFASGFNLKENLLHSANAAY